MIWTNTKRKKTHSNLLDCLWGELYGSINMAEISDGSFTPEHANYLRQKYLYEVKDCKRPMTGRVATLQQFPS